MPLVQQVPQRPKKVKNVKNGSKEKIKTVVKEFFDQSTIHGLKYIGGRPKREKFCWLLVCMISISLCVYEISSIYTKWKDDPVIITIDQKYTPIGQIPFPAITFCGRFTIGNETNLAYDNLRLIMLVEGLEEIESDILDLFEFASGMCFDTLKINDRKYISGLFKNDRMSNFEETAKKMLEANVTDMVSRCRGIGKKGNWPCDRYYVKILTKYGICYTFNMLHKKELVKENVELYLEESKNRSYGWSPDTGYDIKIPVKKIDQNDTFPRRVFTFGEKLQTVVNHYESNQELCLNLIKVFVHHPHDFPWNEKSSLTYETSSIKNMIEIIPEISTASMELQRSLSVKQRNCYFDGERQLMFFKVYSKSNCELECLSNITLSECGCVLFWMPHFKGTKICGITEHKCSSIRAHEILKVNIAFTTSDILEQYDIPFKCNCLDRCNSVTYTAEEKSLPKMFIYEDDSTEEDAELHRLVNLGIDEVVYGLTVTFRPEIGNTTLSNENITSTTFRKRRFLEDDPYNAFVIDNLKNISFHIEFQKPQILAFKRIAPYGISDFIANCGGLLGLFMGISLLSFVEILYFCTFRLMDSIKMAKNNKVESDSVQN